MDFRKLSSAILISLISGFITFASLSAGATNLCANYLSDAPATNEVEKVVISEAAFDQTTKNLRATLSGKLATVWRSEWKTKLSVSESNQYVLQLINGSLTAQSRQFVLQGLDIQGEGFTRHVHERIAQLQEAQQLQPGDDLMVRDKPAPLGTKDSTFTYYTKPIVSAQGGGKHQLRIRTYLREIMYEQIPVGQSVQGFDSNAVPLTITKEANGTYKMEWGADPAARAQQIYTAEQMKQQFGNSVQVHAPHGKSFKLEVKTALEDEILGNKFPHLAGQHMVQKLDVTLSPAQVSWLFAPLTGDPAQKRYESLVRIDQLTQILIAKNPESRARAKAVFNVVRDGVMANENYLSIEGATVYNRTAFESRSGFQTTIDRDQGVYAGNMYDAHTLKSPLLTLKENQLIATANEDARHVEFKLPVTLMQNTVGIIFHDPQSAPTPQAAPNETQVLQSLGQFHKFVKSDDHPGKFNYIRERGVRAMKSVRKMFN